MHTLTFLFSHVCGQGRSFIIDGSPLPVCERCFGLYTGAAITAAWLLASGIRRRGLPHTREVLAQVAMLLAAVVGGMHWIDAGPTWRLLCGLWTGHVAMVWMVAATARLRQHAVWATSNLPACEVRMDPPWPARDRLQMLSAGPALAILAYAFTHLVTRGWWLWAVLVLLGAASLLAALAIAVVTVARHALARRRLPPASRRN